MRKVKVDKKRVKEMIAQDLPAKPRYPIFTAVASLCHTLDAEETEVDANKAVTVNEVAAESATVNTTHHTYTGQGAYMDGPASFVDLEANIPEPNTLSDTSSARKRRRENRKLRKVQQKLTNITTDQLTSGATVNPGTEKPVPVMGLNANALHGEVSDLSDASSASDESTNASSNQSDTISKNNSAEKSSPYSSSNNSYATAGWYDLEPSDDSDVVYLLSSDEEK